MGAVWGWWYIEGCCTVVLLYFVCPAEVPVYLSISDVYHTVCFFSLDLLLVVSFKWQPVKVIHSHRVFKFFS
jgi:hypothetical protein